MNEIEKEIEEMARALKEEKLYALINKTSYIQSAKNLIEQGYRNCKDKVVLTREEYARLKYLEKYHITCEDVSEYMELAQKEERKKMQEELKQASELKAETIRIAKMETAKEILQTIKSYDGWNELQRLRDEIAEEYELEVE